MTTKKLIRGGSWYYVPRYCRSAFRNFDNPRDYRYDFVGFRVSISSKLEKKSKELITMSQIEIKSFDFPCVKFFEKLIVSTLEYAIIPAGEFMMGSPEGVGYSDERPQHLVTLSSFGMATFPVTNAQWAAIAAMPKIGKPLDPLPYATSVDDADLPVVNVSWEDCQEALARLNAFFDGLEFSLPSEAQWEYACRAGTTTVYWYGDSPDLNMMNCYQTFKEGKLTPKGTFPANPWGLYDMHGNVWEWCLDNWHNSYEGAPTDGSAWI